MSRRQAHLFEADRLTMADAVELTVASLQAYGASHDHWAIAYSGGKDSSCTVTLIAHLIATGRVPAPRTLTVLYADTRLELTPLSIAAAGVMAKLRQVGVRVEIVMAPLDKRFFVYMLGRGVPPPNNKTLRWCTGQIKVQPMAAALEQLLGDVGGDILMLTGVRTGESAERDKRIALSCGRDGAECGQGWYQEALPKAKGISGRIATLAPILHWRVCHVWDWLMLFAPSEAYGGFPTRMVADAYGGDEAEEINARTGCIGCPLASQEKALDAILTLPGWGYLAPLKGLKPLYRELRLPRHRLRKAGAEILKDGSLAANPQRMGPLTFEARLMALDRVLTIQAACNAEAMRVDRPLVDILNPVEEARIRELVRLGTWPDGWEGTEPVADMPLDRIFADGTVQPLLTGGVL